ncbi:MAG: phosphatidylethanolamine-binding protein, partial [Proteobacteria bacterium]|nr:phosphatidylethanolamine-binding protein [Pseudomonadota bacterium]
MTAFTLTSPDIPAGGSIAQVFEFDSFGCSGKNQSPVLRWSGAPVGTKSFAVHVY